MMGIADFRRIQLEIDTIDSYRRGIVHRIAQDGYIYSKVKDYFPAIELNEATDAEAKSQWQEAEAQIRQYGAGSHVVLMRRDTQPHLVIVQFRGPKLMRLDDVER